MADCALNMVQYNCQRAYAIMCDLGEMMGKRGVSVALLQEPYVRNGRVCGLPTGMNVITSGDTNVKAAIVVNNFKLGLMRVEECTNEHGVCVWLKGDFGELYVVSVYCQHGKAIEPYLEYMDRLCDVTKGKRVLIGMDANAVSPLWFSKGNIGGRAKELRGRILEDWITGNDMIVLNEPSDEYTFSGPNRESDIDVSDIDE